jgi:membrane protein implicated in regulation of membrane protease activity
MATFTQWWSELTILNQWFFVAAAFFSVFFLWQLVSAMLGIGGGGGDVDTHVDMEGPHHAPETADAADAAFKMISVRSIVAFFTLFTWAGALYLREGATPTSALTRAVLWGVAAMVLVSLLVYGLRRLTQSGNVRLDLCVGTDGTVYLDIPAGGEGEVRVLCGGAMTHLKARAAGGSAMKAGQSVRIARILGSNVVEVEPAGATKERKADA